MSSIRLYFDLIVHNHRFTTNTNLTYQDRHYLWDKILHSGYDMPQNSQFQEYQRDDSIMCCSVFKWFSSERNIIFTCLSSISITNTLNFSK